MNISIHNKRTNSVALFTTIYSDPTLEGGFSRVTVDIEKGAWGRKRPDGKLPAGNHRQFRCYCPLEPLRKVCILTALTEGQRFRVTVSGNRFLAEFRRATEYRMTPTDRNTPFDPS